MKGVERDFRLFQKRGDVRALGRVFDSVAPVLWRLAAHLCADRHEAEDLVQNTFLTAIEKAQAWDSKRPLVPWLLGILSMLARETRRKLQRDIDPERIEAPAIADPADDASARELETALRTAIDKIPEAYRATMTQHLVLGLTASEIADQQEQRAGTVRMQIHRGLSHLRVHLPRGMSTAGIALVMSAAVRANMRAKVLAAAPAQVAFGAAAIGFPVLGVVLMKKFVATAIALAIVSIVVWRYWPASDALLEPEFSQPETITTEVLATDTSTAEESRKSEAADERATRGKARGRVVLRVVNKASGEPVAGLSLQWMGKHIFYGLTDAKGTYIFEDDAGLARIVCDQIFKTEVQVAAGKTLEHIVKLPTRLELELRVVDPDGNPVPHAKILGKTEEYNSLAWGVVGRADAGGVWRGRSIRNGMSVSAAIDGRVPARAIYVVSIPGTSIVKTLQVGEAAVRVSGTVFDTTGRPSPGARVVVQLPLRGRDAKQAELIYLKADAHGRYESYSVPAGRHEFFAFTEHPYEGHFSATRRPREVVRRTVDLSPTASNQVDLELQRGATVVGSVQSADATKLEGHHILANLAEVKLSLELQTAGAGSARFAKNGKYRIEGLLAGKYKLSSRLGDDTVTHDLVVEDNEEYRWDPVHGVLASMRIRLVDHLRKPLKGWHPMLFKAGGGMGREKQTDAMGRCSFENMTSEEYLLQIYSPSRGFPVHAQKLRADDHEIEIVLPQICMPTARLHGRLVANGVNLADLQVRVMRDSRGDANAAMLGQEPQELRFDTETGKFDFGPTIPGSYIVGVEMGRSPLVSSGIKVLSANSDVDIGELVVSGRASLRVVAKDSHGKDLRDFVVFARLPPREDWERIPGDFDARGYFTTRIPPISFEVMVTTPTTAPVFQSAQVIAGQETIIEVLCRSATPCLFALSTGENGLEAARVIVRDTNGRVVVAGHLNQNPGYQEIRTGLAAGSYELECRSGEQMDQSKRRQIVVPARNELFLVDVGKAR